MSGLFGEFDRFKFQCNEPKNQTWNIYADCRYVYILESSLSFLRGDASAQPFLYLLLLTWSIVGFPLTLQALYILYDSFSRQRRRCLYMLIISWWILTLPQTYTSTKHSPNTPCDVTPEVPDKKSTDQQHETQRQPKTCEKIWRVSTWTGPITDFCADTDNNR